MGSDIVLQHLFKTIAGISSGPQADDSSISLIALTISAWVKCKSSSVKGNMTVGTVNEGSFVVVELGSLNTDVYWF